MEWIIPYRLMYYDMDGAIHKLKSIDWVNSRNFQIQVGDKLYMYSGNPEMQIKYVCRVIRTNKKVTTNDETAFRGTPKGVKGNFFEIVLDYEFLNPIVFAELEKYGMKRTRVPVQKSSMNPRLFSFLSKRAETDRESIRKSVRKKKKRTTLRESSKIRDIERNTGKLRGEERNVVVKRRLNQSAFKRSLIKKYGKCCLCGIDDPSILVASHIKPWSKSSGREKLDVNNGLLLCPNHDKLFDAGFISFKDNGKICIAKVLSKGNKRLLKIDGRIRILLASG